MTEVYSWGNGTNYQLGIGTIGIQRIPYRLDALQTLDVTHVVAAKFHSAAVTASGDIYTWSFGHSDRLGNPDFDIHRSTFTYDTWLSPSGWNAWSFLLFVYCISILLVMTKFPFTCSGQVAVIIPRQVISGLVGKRVNKSYLEYFISVHVAEQRVCLAFGLILLFFLYI